jgi:hypothetical protein
MNMFGDKNNDAGNGDTYGGNGEGDTAYYD